MTKKACGIAAVKGGVGKSLISINLAKKLSEFGRTALVDVDVDNSSFLQFSGVKGQIETTKDHQFRPYNWEGIQVFSMSLLAGGERSVSMPGDRYVQIIDDVIERSLWDSDFYVYDLPGSSSDIFRSVMELSAEYLVGNIIICQPSMVHATKKILNLHEYLEIPVLGLIENMSYFKAGAIKYYPFGKSTVDEIAKEYGLEVLGKIPLSREISEGIANGNPLFKGEALKPIEVACEKIMTSEIQRPGFLTRIKEKVTGALKTEIEKVLAGVIIGLNKSFDISGMSTRTGFTEQKPFLFVITDESGTKEITRVGLRVTGDSIKVLRNPEDLDFQIATDFTTLARMIMGKAKRKGGYHSFDSWDAYLNGDLRAYGLGHLPRAVKVFREIFGDEEVMKPIRENYQRILERWL